MGGEVDSGVGWAGRAGVSARDRFLRGIGRSTQAVAGGALGGGRARRAVARPAATTLTNMRADVGAVQERISETRGRNESNQSVLRIARNAVVSADPYETATRLELVQSQLEALYTITARNRQISLVNFLR